MNEWLVGIVIAVGVPISCGLLARFLPRAKTYGIGFKLGRAVATWGSLKLGKVQWEKVGNSLAATIYDISDGIRDGLRLEEKPNPTPPNAIEAGGEK